MKGWEGDRDTSEIFCPRHWLDKCLQEGGFQSGRVPGKSPVWVEALSLGLSTSEGERQIHFSPSWVLQPPPSSEVREFTSDSCQQKGNPSTPPPPLSSGLWQHLEVAVKPWQLRPMETALSSLFHSSPAFKRVNYMRSTWSTCSFLSSEKLQIKKTPFLFSDCFKKSVYFTLLNTGAREE